MRKYISVLFTSVIILAASSCGTEHVFNPKPKGYFRIDFPEKEFKEYNSDCPYIFSYPQYSKIIRRNDSTQYFCWSNIYFPQYKATIYLSYKTFHDLSGLWKHTEDSREFVYKHTIKAEGITEHVIMDKEQKLFGLLYDIEGNTASSLQFYLTDSTQNFVRGALYFNATPNKDSISPVLNFIRSDVYTLIETFHWKNK